MYGLEKNKMERFHFGLESDLKKNPAKAKKFFASIEEKIHTIKSELKKNKGEDLSVILLAYVALKSVMERSLKS